MEMEQLRVGFMAVFCYLIWCDRTREALLIDPAGEEEKLVEYVRNKGANVKYIVNTHGHGDHSCGNAKIKELTGAEIVMHKLDDELFNSPEGQEMSRSWGFAPSPPADIQVDEGDEVVVGDVALKVLHTPGHSPGGICLLNEGNVFTGDTLFVGSIGRTDLPGASLGEFMKSIKEKLLTLPRETIVWPGHDYGDKPSSTIGTEIATNPWLR